jgi:hypothetical protein
MQNNEKTKHTAYYIFLKITKPKPLKAYSGIDVGLLH